MAVYNGEKHIVEMVDSVLAQSFKDFELLLINDGSSDSSPHICEEYAKNDNRIKVIHRENTGLCATRNYGLSIAKAKYICFLDNDDYLYPDMLKEFYKAIEEESMDFYINGYEVVVLNDKGNPVSKNVIASEDVSIYGKENVIRFYATSIGGVVAPIWNMVFSVEYLKSNDLEFDTTLRMSLDDLEFHSRSFFVAERVRVISSANNKYYAREQSSSRKYNPLLEQQTSKVVLSLKENLEKSNLTPDELQKFYTIALHLLVKNNIQNLINSKAEKGRKSTLKAIKALCNNPLVVEIASRKNWTTPPSFICRFMISCIEKGRYKCLARFFYIKQKLFYSCIHSFFKRLGEVTRF